MQQLHGIGHGMQKQKRPGHISPPPRSELCPSAAGFRAGGLRGSVIKTVRQYGVLRACRSSNFWKGGPRTHGIVRRRLLHLQRRCRRRGLVGRGGGLGGRHGFSLATTRFGVWVGNPDGGGGRPGRVIGVRKETRCLSELNACFQLKALC